MKKNQNMSVWLSKMVFDPAFTKMLVRFAKGTTKPNTTCC
jgi:hypothetical protein